MDHTAQDVLDFWQDEVGSDGWYKSDDQVDDTIRRRFGALWETACRGALEGWRGCPTKALAYVLVTDQFPRNMFRGQDRAFKTDGLALRAAKRAVAAGYDLRFAAPIRQFFYLPLMHSEIGSDQARGVRLIQTRMPDGGGSNLLHARAHREVIRRFGRFPYRNAALGRVSTADEERFMAEGGYGAIVRVLEAA